MQHIFHLKEHLSSHEELLSLSFQRKLFKQLLQMMGEQSGKLMTFQRQRKDFHAQYTTCFTTETTPRAMRSFSPSSSLSL